MRAVVRLLIVHTNPDPDTPSQPVHPPNVPLGAAVSVTVEPLAKLLLEQVPAVLAQLNPGGELVTVPEPVPRKFNVMLGPEPPPPPPPELEKQTTFAVM